MTRQIGPVKILMAEYEAEQFAEDIVDLLPALQSPAKDFPQFRGEIPLYFFQKIVYIEIIFVKGRAVDAGLFRIWSGRIFF